MAGCLQRLEYGALGCRRVGSQGELNFYRLAISVSDNSWGKKVLDTRKIDTSSNTVMYGSALLPPSEKKKNGAQYPVMT